MTYVYANRSELRTVGDQTELGLVTTAPDTFLDGMVERADVLAAALLRVADVAATRFYVFATAAQKAAWADPIITTGDGIARFESLSLCCGVAARLDVLGDGLELSTERAGTTNVDLGPDVRHLLAGVLRRDPMRLVVGENGLDVHTLDGQAHEHTVHLSQRWIRALAELQVITSRMTLQLELDAHHLRAFLQTLPAHTSPHGSFWAQPVRGGLRLGTSATPGAVALGGPERLRALAPLLRHSTAVRVYAPDGGGDAASSWWELVLPHARLGLGLSPETARGFSGEGALLEDLLEESPQAELAARGQLGYDVAEGRFFARQLPFGLDVLKANPRLEKAQRLVAAGKVRIDGDLILVAGTRGDHVVRLGADGGPDRCTCRWYAAHQAGRGPCAHVLAARVATGGTGDTGVGPAEADE
jgi:predicted nucleic acid-binding Zn finger protein